MDAGKSAARARDVPELDASSCQALSLRERPQGSEARLASMEPYKLDAGRFEARSFAAVLGLTARLGPLILLSLPMLMETPMSKRVEPQLVSAGLKAQPVAAL